MTEAASAAAAPAEGQQTTDAELERVRRQLAEEQRKRESAEQERDAERARLAAERNERLAAQDQAMTGALQQAQERLAEARRLYAAAIGEGRLEEGAALQERIAQAAQELQGLARQQQHLQQARRTPEEEAALRFEQAVAALPAPAQAWCRSHPEFVTDARKNALAQAAHFAAIGEGLPEWSPDYWSFVEERLGLRAAPEAEDGFEEVNLGREPAAPERAPRRAGATTAAPPSRGALTGTGAPRRRTRPPTAGELEAAKISFPEEWKESPKKALELYFTNRAALIREGRLDEPKG
jgi:hypothetical protein